MRVIISFCFVIVFFASSCRTQKQISNNYLYNVSDTTIKDFNLKNQLLIQPGDLLSIKVYSISNGINPTIDAPYNLAEQATGASSGFLVTQSGNIEYPQIGMLPVAG